MLGLLLLANVLLVVLDDVGIEALSMYGVGPAPVKTPTLEMLASRGVRFDQLRTNPVCTPTRVSLQTGEWAFRSGMGGIVREGNFCIDPADLTLAQDMRAAGLATGAFGKWHMSDNSTWPYSPGLAGYDHFIVTKGNLGHRGQSYNRWRRAENGVEAWENSYACSTIVDDAQNWIQAQTGPWFAYVAFPSAHRPFHTPPAHLHSVQGLAFGGWPGPPVDPRPYWEAMVQAVDAELGRLLASIDMDTTTVVVMADNGTEKKVAGLPFSGQTSKGSLFEGGIRAPLIIAGAAVTRPGRIVDDLVCTVDLTATILSLQGIQPRGDGISLLPYLTGQPVPSRREYSFSENYVPNGPPPHRESEQAITDGRWKLLIGPRVLFFDLSVDPWEGNNLLNHPLTPEQEQALTGLWAVVAEIGAL